MTERALHNEGREPIMRDVQQVLKALREGSNENPEVLAIESYNVMQALNKGFPKHMYHAKLDPVVAMDKQDEKGLMELGYTPHYIPRDYPCWIHRRNFHPKFALELNQHGLPARNDQIEFVESRLVRDAEHMKQIEKEPAPWMPQGVEKPGPWFQKVTDIPPIEAGSAEEQQLEMARLQGRLEEAQRLLSEKGKKAN